MATDARPAGSIQRSVNTGQKLEKSKSTNCSATARKKKNKASHKSISISRKIKPPFKPPSSTRI